MYKAILLDLDQTLYDYETANKAAKLAARAYIEKKYSLETGQIDAAVTLARQEVHAQLHGTGSSHNRLLYYQRALEHLKIKGYAELIAVHDVFWDTFFSGMRLFNGVGDFLQSRKQPLCIVTDFTAEIQFKKLRHLNILDQIDLIVTSEEAGIEKPAPRIFALALEKLRLQPGDVCMVGDDWQKDIRGAAESQIASFWFNPRGFPPGDDTPTVPFSDFKLLTGFIND